MSHSCSNPNCISYVPNCTNYTYVCPSCTDCCTEIINTNCIKYKGAALSCIPVATNDTLTTIITAINTKFCASAPTFNIQCLGGASNASQTTTVQALIDYACTVNTNLFDTSCLGGEADVSIYTAVSNIITKICASSASYPTFDTTCMDGGALTDSLANAVNLLITNVCTGPVCTLDWDALVAPSQLVGTPLCDMLDAIVDNLRCVSLTFSDEFTVSANTNCTKDVELNLPVATQNILDTIESTSIMVEQLRDMGLAKMFANEDCGKGSIEEKIAFTNKFEVTKVQLTPYDFTMTYGDGGGTNRFLGIILPNGIKYEATFVRTDTTSIKAWLDSFNLGTFTVTATTVSVTMDGDLTDYYPIIIWSSTPGSTELYSTITGSQNAVTTCEYLNIDLDAPDEWTSVSYTNLWTGDLKYRYNKFNNTVEIRGGYINKSISPSFTSSFSESAFTIPYNSDGRATWKFHAETVNTCQGEEDCEKVNLNARVHILNNTQSFYVDLDSCRTEACSPGDFVTIYTSPIFYYVL